MKQLALTAWLLLAFSLGCAGPEQNQTTQALDGKWIIDTTVTGQREMAGAFWIFNVRENQAAVGFESSEKILRLSYNVLEPRDGFMVLDMWPLDDIDDSLNLQFKIKDGRLFMSDPENTRENFIFVRP